MGNPPGADQALSVSGAADAFRALSVGKPEAAPAEEKPEANANATPEGAEAEATPEAPAAEGEGDDTPPADSFDDKTKRYRVKVDGVESQVSFEELRNGYQRHSDYQAKMRKVAEAQQQADAQRQTYLQRIDSVVPQLEAALMGEFADIRTMQDVAKLAEAEPARYVKWQAAQMALNNARSERDRVAQEHQQRHQEQIRHYVAEQHKQLSERLPEWGDADKGPKLKADLRRYLKAEGFSDDEIGTAADHRLVVMANKARLFDEAQKARVAAAKAAATVPKVQKPGTTSKTNPAAEATQAAFERLSKTGRVDDAANVFKGMKLFG
jgi:hypothetical protein